MDVADGSSSQGHAAVVGAGMAGLLAARVLADHFGRVTILERDRLPAGPDHRQGVPQSRHLHVLLLRGYREMERLFPGFDAELATAGSPEIDWLADLRWLSFGGWKPRFPSNLKSRGASRPLLEWIVRRRLAARPEIRFIQDTEVTGLLPDRGGRQVAGVRIEQKGDGGTAQELYADLVVDASGSSSRTPQWLDEIGYPAPEETRVNAFPGYASRWYQPPPGFSADWKGLYLQAMPPAVKRSGVIYPIEDERWMVTLAGLGRDHPPVDEEGFLRFIRELPDPCLYDALQGAQPLSPIHGFRRMENRMRHYDRLSPAPERLVVLGDAACTFNPVYGQGMTVAALEALTLDRCLRGQPAGDLTGLSRLFQRRLARLTAVPWILATSEDFRVPEVEGHPPGFTVRAMQRYVDQVIVLSTHDPKVYLTVAEVLTMLRPPFTLFRPSIAARVLAREVPRRRTSVPDIDIMQGSAGHELG